MASEFVVTTQGTTPIAIVSKPDGESLARLVKSKDGTTRVELKNEVWKVSHKVDNEVRPFSIEIVRVDPDELSQSCLSGRENDQQREDEKEKSRAIILKIRDHMFSYKGKLYMIGNAPEGRAYRDLLSGGKYISLLVNFPFSDPSDVDVETRNRLRRIRGMPMGEISGIGLRGHRVKLQGELEEIGLQVAIASYILYTTGSVHPSKRGVFTGGVVQGASHS